MGFPINLNNKQFGCFITMSEPIIELKKLSVKYPGEKQFAIRDISFQISRGEIICVMGPAGAGKTTLCLCLNGLIPNSIKCHIEGSVNVMGNDTRSHKVSDFSKYVGIVFQDPDTQLFCSSVEEEVGYILSVRSLPRELIKDRVREFLDKVGLSGYEDRAPHSLSGGEKQKVAIASVLSLKPEILVLDEPTSQLDPLGTADVFDLIEDLSKKDNMTILITEHKSEEIAKIADRILVLINGKIGLEGNPRKIFSEPSLLDRFGIKPPQVSEAFQVLFDNGIIHSNIPVTYEKALRSSKKYFL